MSTKQNTRVSHVLAWSTVQKSRGRGVQCVCVCRHHRQIASRKIYNSSLSFFSFCKVFFFLFLNFRFIFRSKVSQRFNFTCQYVFFPHSVASEPSRKLLISFSAKKTFLNECEKTGCVKKWRNLRATPNTRQKVTSQVARPIRVKMQ